MVDTIQSGESTCRTLGIVLKSEFALPVALAFKQCGATWADSVNHNTI